MISMEDWITIRNLKKRNPNMAVFDYPPEKVNQPLKIKPGDYVAFYQDLNGNIYVKKADIK
ncbi:MAG: hypothetical protein LWX55_16050 [Deltaproteobacteria bacterium]|nr:hypothetical protein [Deltaproteobacteria bacterium]